MLEQIRRAATSSIPEHWELDCPCSVHDAEFTGLNSTQAAKAELSFFTSVTVDPNHASYYHGSSPIKIKIVANECLRSRNPRSNYAPPFGSAYDPVNTAGLVADYIMRGGVSTISPKNCKLNNEFLLDGRESGQVAEFGMLRNALHIPMDDLP